VPPEAASLVEAITAEAYKAGSSLVDIMYLDDGMQLMRIQHAPDDSLKEFPEWVIQGMIQHIKNGGALIAATGGNPDLLRGQDQERVARVQKAYAQHLQPVTSRVTSGDVNWLVMGAPTEPWARKVFPEMPSDQALASLWELVFDICRVNEPDPLAAWETHLANLAARSAYMNERRYTSLHMTGPGTDLTIGLPDKHSWKGGAGVSKAGVPFTANIPTEEIFTMPHKDKTEGIVRATMPLSYRGMLIDDFSMAFKDGRVVDVQAGIGDTVIRRLIEIDEGSARLGEIALTPQSSPIAQSGRLFYHTLYDENASSHIALGRAYADNMTGAADMSAEELAAAGVNNSLIHVDFMIGSTEMDVDGIRADGVSESVMRSGEWTFEV
jgi:aminopeptidase